MCRSWAIHAPGGGRGTKNEIVVWRGRAWTVALCSKWSVPLHVIIIEASEGNQLARNKDFSWMNAWPSLEHLCLNCHYQNSPQTFSLHYRTIAFFNYFLPLLPCSEKLANNVVFIKPYGGCPHNNKNCRNSYFVEFRYFCLYINVCGLYKLLTRIKDNIKHQRDLSIPGFEVWLTCRYDNIQDDLLARNLYTCRQLAIFLKICQY